MRYFVKSMYHCKTTIYARATYSEALRFARELRSKHACLSTRVYTDKGDSSTWNKATWNEFYADLIKEFKEVCDD
jgi:hypothetical protein